MDYPSANTPRAPQPARHCCQDRCLAGSRFWLQNIIRKMLLCFPAHLAREKQWVTNAYTTSAETGTAAGLFQGWLCFPNLKGDVPLAMLCAKGVPGDRPPAFSSGVPRLKHLSEKNPPNKYGKKHSHKAIKKYKS